MRKGASVHGSQFDFRHTHTHMIQTAATTTRKKLISIVVRTTKKNKTGYKLESNNSNNLGQIQQIATKTDKLKYFTIYIRYNARKR